MNTVWDMSLLGLDHLQVAISFASTKCERRCVMSVVVHRCAHISSKNRRARIAKVRAFAATADREANAKIVVG